MRALILVSGRFVNQGDDADAGEAASGVPEPELGEGRQRQFFEFAGPLFSVAVSPASLPTNSTLPSESRTIDERSSRPHRL